MLQRRGKVQSVDRGSRKNWTGLLVFSPSDLGLCFEDDLGRIGLGCKFCPGKNLFRCLVPNNLFQFLDFCHPGGRTAISLVIA